MSFVAAPDSPPVFKVSPNNLSESEENESFSDDSSDGDIQNALDAPNAFVSYSHDSPLDNGAVGEPEFRLRSDLNDADEITMHGVRDILGQMPTGITRSAVTAMLKMPAKQSCIIHPVWQGRAIKWERADNVEAILVQIVGTENPNACLRCAAGRGPFVGCYSFPGVHNGGCGCCNYNGQATKCSLFQRSGPKRARPQNRPRRPRKMQKVGDNENGTAGIGANIISANAASSPVVLGDRIQLGSPVVADVGKSLQSVLSTQPQQRFLQVPIPAELGWEDAMTLRHELHVMVEGLVFNGRANKVVRKVLREFSGALEDFASEENH